MFRGSEIAELANQVILVDSGNLKPVKTLCTNSLLVATRIIGHNQFLFLSW